MILYLTIAIIIWLALTCVYFINDARKSKEDTKYWRSEAKYWQESDDFLHGVYLETWTELQKWKRPRAKNGRFKK